MPVIASVIWGAFLNIIGSVVGRALVALGLGVVTFTGMNASLDWMRDQAVSSILQLDPQVVQLLGVLKVGTFISIISSAVAVRLLLNGVQSGTFKRWVLK
ncbi:DUF2523 domain-containing protein [Comamonas kerstersii]